MPTNTKATRNDDEVVFDIKVGERIRAWRRAAGMTQTELARASGVTFQQVQKYERGTNRVAASRLSSISRAVGVTAAELLGEEIAAGPSLTAAQKRLLNIFDQATPEQQKLAISFLESLTRVAA